MGAQADRPRRVGIYAAAFSFIALTRHLTLQTHALDLGYYVQVVWSIALLLVDVHWIMPYFRGAPYRHLYRYTHLGSSVGGILVSPLVRPGVVIRTVLTAAKARYLLALLAPLGFLRLFAPRALAAALPGLAMNLLSRDPRLYHHRSQYVSFVLPFLILAAVEGYRALGAAAPGRRRIGRLSPAVALAVAAFASVAPTSRTVNELAVSRWWPDERVRAVHRLMARVPPMASITTNERLVPHLATRPTVFVSKEDGLLRAEWLLEQETVVGSAPGFEVIARDGGYALARTVSAKRG